MPKEIAGEIRDQAQDLYIFEGYTYDQVAEATGVSRSQVQRWGADEGWPDKKREYRRASSEIRWNTVRLRRDLIKNALDTLDPQAVYAAANFERAAQKTLVRQEQGLAPAADGAIEPREIHTPAEAVAALQAVVERKVNRMLSGGDVSLAGIKEMQQALVLIEKMQAKYTTDDGEDVKEKVLDAEAVRNIREQLNL